MGSQSWRVGVPQIDVHSAITMCGCCHRRTAYRCGRPSYGRGVGSGGTLPSGDRLVGIAHTHAHSKIRLCSRCVARAMASVERFNPDDLVWERLSHMSSRRSHCGAAALGGRLWVVGGLDSMSRLRAGRGQEIVHSTVEVHDPEADQWDEYPEALPHQCWGSAVSAAGGRLYVVGGYADQQTTDVALCLKPRGNASNPQGSSWKVLAPMPTRRWGAGGVAA